MGQKYVSCSVFQFFETSWTVACQIPLCMEFFRQEHWSGLLFPFSRGSFGPRNQTWVFCFVDRFFTICANRGTELRNNSQLIFFIKQQLGYDSNKHQPPLTLPAATFIRDQMCLSVLNHIVYLLMKTMKHPFLNADVCPNIEDSDLVTRA